jgi:hypothetical protein
LIQQLAPATRSEAGKVGVLAQTPAEWAAWAQRLGGALEASAGEDSVTSDASGRPWRVEGVESPDELHGTALASASGRTRWIVFVDSPARYLALHAGLKPDVSPQDLLAAWCESARRTLAVVHALRARCLVLDSEESLSSPAAVAHCVAGWLGVDLLEQRWPVAPERNTLLVQVAEEFVQNDRHGPALWAELLACCSPLPCSPQDHLGSEPPARAAADRLLRVQALVAAAERADELTNRVHEGQRALAAVRAELATANEGLAGLRQLLHEERQKASETANTVEAERAALTAAANHAREEADQLLAQLHQVQEELEKQFLESQASRLAGASDGGDSVSVQAEPTHAVLAAEAKDAREEAELLLLQLHHVQEELEAHFLALQDTRQALVAAQRAAETADGRMDGLGFRVHARHTQISGARTERPHCELDLVFGEVTVGPLQLERVAVRLLEHEGRAGLALVAMANLPAPITQWAPDGNDGRGAFMLFIPGDLCGRERLATLGTRNWQMLRGLATLARRAAADTSTPESAYWQTVAGRLWVALEAFPGRLRYDAMTAQQVDGQTIDLRLEGVCFGSRSLPPVALRWTPGNHEAPLKLLRTDERLPCLAAWPAGADGVLAAELVLPVANEGSIGSRLRWWAQLLPADRDLALALVDTLAAVPAALPEGADSARRRQLAVQAARLRRRLHRSLHLGRWARRLRQVLRGRRN